MLRRLLSLILIVSLLAGTFACAETVIDEKAAPAGYVLLCAGDRDEDDSTSIVRLQNRLKALGYLRSRADGIYGGDTINAVREFQRSNALEQSGEASPELQQLLYSESAVRATRSADPDSVAYRVQRMLGVWGFTTDEPDGVAGDMTGEAIADFRDYLRRRAKEQPAPRIELGGEMPLPVDERIDPSRKNEITQEVLDYVNGAKDFEVFRQSVAKGDKGEEVWRVQRRLHLLKYLALVDGAFGETTERALIYFQKKSGLAETGVADEATQRALFSETAPQAEEYVNLYKLVVDVSDQRVYVYQWDGSSYDTLVGEMICSTGIKGPETETPLGVYQAVGPTESGEWYWFEDFKCYAKWGYRIIGGILFHSVIYSKGKSLNRTSVKKLGKPASHGCVRLRVEHAKWIYDNCAAGTTVVIQA